MINYPRILYIFQLLYQYLSEYIYVNITSNISANQRWARVPVDLCVPACQRSSCFPSRSAFPRSCTTFFRVPLVSCVPVPVSRSWCKCGGGGATHHTRAVCVWTDQAGRVNSPPRHYPPPPVMRARCSSLLAGSQFGVKLVSRPQSPPSTSPVSTRHNCVISSQEREYSGPILSRSAFPHSCIKFAFPRTFVPKIPGARERKTRNARPSLLPTKKES